MQKKVIRKFAIYGKGGIGKSTACDTLTFYGNSRYGLYVRAGRAIFWKFVNQYGRR